MQQVPILQNNYCINSIECCCPLYVLQCSSCWQHLLRGSIATLNQKNIATQENKFQRLFFPNLLFSKMPQRIQTVMHREWMQCFKGVTVYFCSLCSTKSGAVLNQVDIMVLTVWYGAITTQVHVKIQLQCQIYLLRSGRIWSPCQVNKEWLPSMKATFLFWKVLFQPFQMR